MNMIYLPKWIYEVLPVVYLLTGLMAMVGTGNNLGRASGLLLLLVTAFIFKLRRDVRQASRRSAMRMTQADRPVTFLYRSG